MPLLFQQNFSYQFLLHFKLAFLIFFQDFFHIHFLCKLFIHSFISCVATVAIQIILNAHGCGVVWRADFKMSRFFVSKRLLLLNVFQAMRLSFYILIYCSSVVISSRAPTFRFAASKLLASVLFPWVPFSFASLHTDSLSSFARTRRFLSGLLKIFLWKCIKKSLVNMWQCWLLNNVEICSIHMYLRYVWELVGV